MMVYVTRPKSHQTFGLFLHEHWSLRTFKTSPNLFTLVTSVTEFKLS